MRSLGITTELIAHNGYLATVRLIKFPVIVPTTRLHSPYTRTAVTNPNEAGQSSLALGLVLHSTNEGKQVSSPTELLLHEALTHLYLHREDPAHTPNADLYARIEGHLRGLHSGGVCTASAPFKQIIDTEQKVPVVYCAECGGAKYPWIEYHDDDCSRQHLSL